MVERPSSAVFTLVPPTVRAPATVAFPVTARVWLKGTGPPAYNSRDPEKFPVTVVLPCSKQA